jgi:TQXA domain-containing protein
MFVSLTLLGGFLLAGQAAQAQPIPGPGTPTRDTSPFTELRVLPITGDLGVSNVDGYDAPSSYDPVRDGYPEATDVPTTWDQHDSSYVGLIPTVDGAGETVLTYCIDLFTSTQSGVTYERDEWSDANVRNLGYVAHILQNYYPSEPQPDGVANNVKSAAVQAAIWFFTDNLVLDPAQEPELFRLASQIVNDALENGPASEPEQPDLSISPDTGSAPSTGEIVGPFTVTANGPSVLEVDGVEVFRDAAGSQPVVAGDTVEPGAELWVRSSSGDEPQGFSLRREELVRESTVYVYDGSIPGRDTAQKLILARDTTLEAVASVRVDRFAAGGIEVTKTISGDGAGLQGEVEILVVCTPPDGGDPIERRATIDAGTAAGSESRSFTGLPAGAECVVTEPEDGDNEQVDLTATSIDPETVTVVANVNTPVAVTNVYERSTGALEVTKTISGDGAGLQGEVEILVVCTPPDGGDPIERRATIPAGTAAGSESRSFTGLPAGADCVVTEPEDGDNEQVNLTATSIEPETVTVVENVDTPVAVTNEYERAVGGLQVTKRIGGPAAGKQGEIVLVLDCDDPEDAFDDELTLPARTPAGDYSATVTGIPVGTQCQITETASGVTEQIVLVEPTTIEPGVVEIADGETREITVTNNYREEEHGGGGGGGGGFGDAGYGGSSSSGFLPDTGAPASPLPLGLALVAGGAAVLLAERRLARKS